MRDRTSSWRLDAFLDALQSVGPRPLGRSHASPAKPFVLFSHLSSPPRHKMSHQQPTSDIKANNEGTAFLAAAQSQPAAEEADADPAEEEQLAGRSLMRRVTFSEDPVVHHMPGQPSSNASLEDDAGRPAPGRQAVYTGRVSVLYKALAHLPTLLCM